MASKKVLLVDDDRDFVDANRLVLESRGYEVFSAHDSEAGREKALEVEPDLIVLDVMMETHEAGFVLARWLRGNEATAGIPIIMLTGVNQQYPLKFGKDDIWLPVDEFLEKPIEPDTLLDAVESKIPEE